MDFVTIEEKASELGEIQFPALRADAEVEVLGVDEGINWFLARRGHELKFST